MFNKFLDNIDKEENLDESSISLEEQSFNMKMNYMNIETLCLAIVIY